MAFLKLNHCLACGSRDLRNILNLKDQPLANSYTNNIKEKEKKYELKVKTCYKCTHLQLSVAVDPKKIYKKYDYLSGTTKTYLEYMNSFYSFCIKNRRQTFEFTRYRWSYSTGYPFPQQNHNLIFAFIVIPISSSPYTANSM